jgi:hypothetical protein
MDGGAFNWLKTGGIGRKSRKQAEIRLFDLLKILSIGRETVGGRVGPGFARNGYR